MAFTDHDDEGHVYMAKAGKYFAASVVNINDPTENFMVKCRVAGIDASTPDADLPWCKPFMSLGAGTVMGCEIPAVGMQVWVFFPEEDGQFRYLVGKNMINISQLKALIPSYPYGYATVDAMGTTIVADTKLGTYQIIFPDGSGYQYKSGTMNIIGTGVLNIKGGEELNLYGPTVNINGNAVNIGGLVNTNATTTNAATQITAGTPATPSYPPAITEGM